MATYKYAVYGAVRSSTGTGSTEYRFTAQQDDAALGYTYLRARYYDAQTGRFLSKDPFPGVLTNPASQHYYCYAYNNPINVTDPTGHHLEGLHRFAGDIFARIAELATMPAAASEKVVDLLFDIQWTSGYFRQIHLRPFTLRFSSMLLAAGGLSGEYASGSVKLPMIPDAQEFLHGLEEKLRGFSARGAHKKGVALVALAGACLHVRHQVEAMVGSTAPPIEELWSLLTGAERLGWWVDETYSWLHLLAIRLVYRMGGDTDQVILKGIMMKAALWQGDHDRIRITTPGSVM